jgi:hypothetical protein
MVEMTSVGSAYLSALSCSWCCARGLSANLPVGTDDLQRVRLVAVAAFGRPLFSPGGLSGSDI